MRSAANVYVHDVRVPRAQAFLERARETIIRYSSAMSQAALCAVVSGRVQLVMFRDFTQRKALGLGLVGEVANLPDGTVRVIAEGAPEKLDMLIAHLTRGPVLARVDDVRVEKREPTGAYTSFSIIYRP